MDVNKELVQALEFSDSIVVLTDTKGRIRYVNNSFVTKYGYTKEEALGKRPSILKSDYHDSQFYSDLWLTITAGETWRGVFRNVAKNGSYIWEKATISAVKNEDGSHTGYVAVKEDITRERDLELQLDSERSLLDELFSNSPIGIGILKPVYEGSEVKDFIIVRANPAAANVVGKLGVVGLRVSEILPKHDLDENRLKLVTTRKTSFESHFKDIGKHIRYRTVPFGKNNICLFFYDVSPYRQTIKALEASEERYFTLVEDAPALISRFDKDGVLTYVNDQYCKTFQSTQEELLGQSIYNWFSDDEKELSRKSINALTAENPISVVEHRLVLKNGEVKWMRWLDRALVDSKGEIFEYQSIGMDLTQLKQTELQLTQHRNKLDAIVNSTIAGIGVVSSTGRFALVNERLQNMLGFDTKEEMYTKTHLDITHPDWQKEASDNYKKLSDGIINDYNIECVFLRKNGDTFWGDLHVSPLKDENGKILEVIGIVTDISNRKKIEFKLKEREKKLEELNATKDKLFSIIAHDIKNPFNSILGFSNLLKSNLDTNSKEETKAYVDQILIASENVYKLLDDLLIWAKSQLGQMVINRKHFRIKSLFEAAYENYGVMAENKGVFFSCDIAQNETLFADFDMMKFVVRNLVHNAIKFTNKNGEVRCSSFIENNNVVISIRDTGIGIRPEKLRVLFDVSEFMETSGTSEEKGTGLGLHLSYEMVQRHGGRIEVESIVEKGTDFMIYIPLSKG